MLAASTAPSAASSNPPWKWQPGATGRSGSGTKIAAIVGPRPDGCVSMASRTVSESRLSRRRRSRRSARQAGRRTDRPLDT